MGTLLHMTLTPVSLLRPIPSPGYRFQLSFSAPSIKTHFVPFIFLNPHVSLLHSLWLKSSLAFQVRRQARLSRPSPIRPSPIPPSLSAFCPVTLPLLVLTQTQGKFFPKCAGSSPLPSVYTSSKAAPLWSVIGLYSSCDHFHQCISTLY